MQDLKISLIQTDQIWEDKFANFSMYEGYFRQITETDIILLPEMFHTGFSMSVDQLAEDWQDSLGIEFLKHWSNQLQSAIYTSLIIREAGKFFNWVERKTIIQLEIKRLLLSGKDGKLIYKFAMTCAFPN